MASRTQRWILLLPLLAAGGCADRALPTSPGAALRPSLDVQGGASIVVNNAGDAGVGGCTTAGDGDGCTLREAVLAASPGGTISFAVAGQISLGGGQIAIDRALTIDGPGAAQLAVSGGGASRVLLVQVPVGTPVTIRDLTIEDGFLHGPGGCIQNSGAALTLTRVVVQGCEAWGAGGGIGNTGFGALLVEQSIVRDNWAANGGGGIYNDHSGALTITGSTVADNLAQQDGGGIGSTGYVDIVNSTISGNAAWRHGGGVFAGHRAGYTLEADFVTVAGNTADANGNGDGDGGGIYVEFTAARLLGAVVADNADDTPGAGAPDCAATGPGSSVTFSLIENPTGCDNLLAGGADNLVEVDPELASLADAGGPTWTHAIDAASPAWNAGGQCALATDQRGFPRPVSGACDMGAFELGALQVAIDVKPGSADNPVNPGAKGTVPVAILSAAGFDAATVDVSTIRLGPGAAAVALRPNGTYHSGLEDVNGDGLQDLVVHVDVQALALTATTTSLELTGALGDGTAIAGSDAIRIVP